MTTRGHNPSAGGSRISRRLPLDARERKKVAVLILLAGVCALVLVPQLWKHRGPSTAYADSITAPQAAIDLEAVLEQMRSSFDKPVGEGRVFETVDEALELFQGGARPLAVPVEELRERVFGVPLSVAGAKVRRELSPALAAQAGDKSAVPAELKKLCLETVLVSSFNRAAIINGQVLHVGETVEGFRIEEIAIDRVSLSRDGKKYKMELQ